MQNVTRWERANYAEHLAKRREMMGWWADYLDELAAGAKVVSFQKK